MNRTPYDTTIHTQAEADALNAAGTYGPYRAANWHLMIAPLRFPADGQGFERELRIGDPIRYTTWDAWCAPGCRHDAPPEDW